jgi:exo-1,4-beta-D-glucosaminidase
MVIIFCILFLFSLIPLPASAQVTVVKTDPAFTLKLTSWKIAPVANNTTLGAGVATGGEDAAVAVPGYDTQLWEDAAVPGTVLGNLIDDGVYDPIFTADNDGLKNVFFSDNMSKIPVSDFAQPWWYSTDFNIPAAEAGKRISIQFKGISFTGEIYVNGQKLRNKNLNIKSEDELKNAPPVVSELTDITNTAQNDSSVRYDLVFDEYKELFKGTMRTYDVDITDYVHTNGQPNNIKVKVTKPTYTNDLTYYWVDWNPQPADTMMGLTGEVTVTTSGLARLDNPAVASDVAEDHSTADLSFYVDVSNMSASPLTGSLSAVVRDPAGAVVTTLTKTGIQVASNAYNQEIALRPDEFPQLHLTDPQLWWPYLSGDQPLYTIDYQFSIGGAASDGLHHRFGIREIGAEVNVSPYANQNGASISNSSLANMLQIYVNHRPILLKGGGYCASDLFLRHSAATNQAVVDYVKYMGMNMIRDEGKFFDNDLLDMLDENGILLMTGWCCCDRWQSPGSWSKAERFVAFESLYSQLRNARSHASMFIWFNGSDDPPSISNTGVNGKQIEQKYMEIEAQLRWFDIGAVSSSGSAKVATLTNVTGGMHMDATYDTQTPTWYYFDYRGDYGFVSEGGGGASIPVLETMRRILPEANLWPYNTGANYNVWNYHVTRGGFSTLSHFATFVDGSYGASGNLEEFLARAQVYQYDVQRAQYEALNMNRYKNTSGMINWMLNNAWPLLFWNQFDYYMNPNGTTFGARKGNEPVHIMYDMYHKQVSVVNNTLEAVPGAVATLAVYDIEGNLISKPLEKRLDIRPDGASTPVNYATSGSNRLGPQQVGLRLKDDGSYEKYMINYYGVVEETYGVTDLWSYGDIQGALERPTSDVYFLRLELKDADGKVISYNSYAEPMRSDIAGVSHSWNRSGTYQVPDMTQLNQLPPVELQAVQTGTRTEGGRVVQTLAVTNPGDDIAYAVELKAYRDSGKKTLVAPVIYEDNLFILFPHETRVIDVSHYEADLVGDAVIQVSCYNNIISPAVRSDRAAANIYGAVPAGGSNNLARGRTVTGGTNPGNATTVPAAGQTNANNGKTFIDSNINTVTTIASGAAVTLDLGSVQAFDRIMLRWNAASGNSMLRGRPDHVKVEISNRSGGNAQYTTIAEYDNTAGSSVMTNIVLDRTYEARYIRVTPTGLVAAAPAVGVVSALKSSGAAAANAPTSFSLSAVEVYAFRPSVFLDIRGEGRVTADDVAYDRHRTANQRLISLRDGSLNLTLDGETPLVYRDGKDITDQLAGGRLALTDIEEDTTIQVIFAPGAMDIRLVNGEIRADVLIINRTGAEKTYSMIVAVYDGAGRLLTTRAQTVAASEEVSEVVARLPLGEVPGAASAKVFLWGGQPYIPALPDETWVS